MCMRQTGQPYSTITPAIPESPRDETSLIMSAPACNDADATVDLLVSTEIPISGNSSLMDLITGTTRASSSRGGTARDPGLVDSPPTSIQSAPFSAIAIASLVADSTVSYLDWP